jgi:hypothetical protein
MGTHRVTHTRYRLEVQSLGDGVLESAEVMRRNKEEGAGPQGATGVRLGRMHAQATAVPKSGSSGGSGSDLAESTHREGRPAAAWPDPHAGSGGALAGAKQRKWRRAGDLGTWPWSCEGGAAATWSGSCARGWRCQAQRVATSGCGLRRPSLRAAAGWNQMGTRVFHLLYKIL